MGLVRGEALALPGPGNAWLFADNGRAIIHVNGTTPDEPVPSTDTRGRVHHIAFDCRDYDGMVRRLTALGQPYQRHETAVKGLVLLTTSDPNGITLEFSFGVDNAMHPKIARAS